MITHEEARKELRYVDVVSSNNLLSNYISQQEKLQAEHEALKKDVARFIEFRLSDDLNSDDWQEYLALKDKLSKVGKKE